MLKIAAPAQTRSHSQVLGTGASTYEFGAQGHNSAHSNVKLKKYYKLVYDRLSDQIIPN